MAQYPTLANARYKSVGGGRMQKVLTGNVDDLGKEFRKRKWLYKKRTRTIAYPNISNEELRILLQFQDDRDLTFGSFTFIDEYPEDYENEYIATGDGIVTEFNIPGVDTSATLSVYGDGTPYNQAPDATSAGDYYIIEAGGLYSEDQITFFVPPNAGVRLNCYFTGKLAMKARLSGEIQYQRTNVYLKLNSAQVSLQGLLWDES